MDEGKVAKSSDEHTEEIELSQNKRRSSRRKNKNERDIVNDKDEILDKSSKEQIGRINIEILTFFFFLNYDYNND
jgi:hypothetical protein